MKITALLPNDCIAKKRSLNYLKFLHTRLTSTLCKALCKVPLSMRSAVCEMNRTEKYEVPTAM